MCSSATEKDDNTVINWQRDEDLLYQQTHVFNGVFHGAHAAESIKPLARGRENQTVILYHIAKGSHLLYKRASGID